MKKIHLALAVLALGAVMITASVVTGGTGKSESSYSSAKSGTSLAWLDMKNCDFCAPFVAEKGLLDHVHMDPHVTATGEMCVTTVPAEYEAAYQRAKATCDALVARALQGEKFNLCGYCNGLLELGQSGAKIEQFDTKTGYVLLVSATTPETVKKINSHADRTIAEMETMMAKK